MIPKILVPVIAVAVVVIIAMFGFSSQNYAIHALLILAPVGMMLAGNIPLVFVIIIALYRSTLIVPGLPQGLAVVDVAILFIVLLMLATNAISKNRFQSKDLAPNWLIAFFCVVALTIYVRGIGIRIFGSDLWGGMSYVKLTVYILFYLVCRQITFTETMIKRSLIGMVLLSLIPVAAQLVFLLSGGKIYQQFAFVEAYATGLLGTLDAMQGGGQSTARFYFSGFGVSLLTAGLAFLPFTGWRRFLLAFIVLFSTVMALLSGFRSTILLTIGLVYVYALLIYPHRRISITAAGIAAFFAALLLLIPFIRDMPSAVQRALAWVPFFDIPFEIRLDASLSTTWRLGVWEMAIKEIPEYLLIGKGFAFASIDLLGGFMARDADIHAFISHNYHSGPISLMLDLGVAGFVTATMFMVLLVVDTLRGYVAMRKLRIAPMVFRLYCILGAMIIYQVFAFYLIYGDARSSINDILFNATILQVIRYNYGKKPTEPAPDSEKDSIGPSSPLETASATSNIRKAPRGRG
jgi:Na+-transporting methylmalonyl-CoA/oxaloacetate decarboxylase gamma subunit